MNIGIVIPTFNSEKTIEETLSSLSRCENLSSILNVYIADDCSTDETLDKIKKKWSAGPDLICFRYDKNVGERANINRTIEKIKTHLQWFFILHSDDMVKPNWITELLNRIQSCKDSVGSISSSWDAINKSGAVSLGEDQEGFRLYAGNKERARWTLLLGGWWHISGCAIRIKCFEDVGGFCPEMPQFGDIEWVVRCFLKGWSVEFIPRSLVIYRLRVNSVSAQSFKTNRDLDEYLMLARQYRQILRKMDLFKIHMKLLWTCFIRLVKALICFEVGVLPKQGRLCVKIFFQWIQVSLFKL